MDYISSDTNIWLDFMAIRQTALPFLLPYTYIMFEEALRKEIISPPGLLQELEQLGLKGVDLTTEEFYYALFDGHYINKAEYLSCLESFLQHTERRLPAEELQKRIDSLTKI